VGFEEMADAFDSLLPQAVSSKVGTVMKTRHHADISVVRELQFPMTANLGISIMSPPASGQSKTNRP
jgi:hypothetical protein